MVNEIGSVTSLPVTALRSGQPATAPAVPGGGRVIPMQSSRAAGHADASASLSAYAQKVAQKSGQGEVLAELAVDVRKINVGLDKADALLNQIQENLTKIVKQYPPFEQESTERVRLLNTISGLRKQLDALAFPPERKSQESAPVPLYPVKGDLAVPELDPKQATDAEVVSALEQIEKMRAGVAAQRERLWKDVTAFVSEPTVAQAEADLAALQQFVGSSSGVGLGGNFGGGLGVGLRAGPADMFASGS